MNEKDSGVSAVAQTQATYGAQRARAEAPSTGPKRSETSALSCRSNYTLRVNVLEQCQYDCSYCRPGSLQNATPKQARLTVAEYRRLSGFFSALGVDKVRFTGGEPLLRDEILDIITAFKTGIPGVSLALTTNGQRLAPMLHELSNRGLSGITVHVDSLKPERYQRLMGPGDVNAVLETVLAAKTMLKTVKLNVVVQRDQNDDELPAFLDWSRRTGIEVRFIELMNTGSAVEYTRRAFVSGRDIIGRLAQTTRVVPVPRRTATDPAALFKTTDGLVFGLIASDTEPFCEACNRLRLSPDGRLRGCLYEALGAPLMSSLRGGATDEQMLGLLRVAVGGKRSHHPTLPAARQAFSMADVGG
jgi:cyclic pyranopterin phosphate synthase